jgi:hypothetical protein
LFVTYIYIVVGTGNNKVVKRKKADSKKEDEPTTSTLPNHTSYVYYVLILTKSMVTCGCRQKEDQEV